MILSDFLGEALHFVRPGELRGSYTNQDLIRMGFRQASTGAWYIDQRRWDQLVAQGQLREQQALQERVSSTLYHYTNVYAGAKIMQQGQFELTSVLGTDWEQRFAPPGYPYYLSATRTLTGGYHDYVGSAAVMFVLAGDWFNARFPGNAVDYWGNRAPDQSRHRAHEAEDRIFSKRPTMGLGGVQAVHVLVKPDAEPNRRTWARQLIMAVKKRGIPAYLYSDEKAWRRFDTSHTAPVSTLRGEISYGRSPSRHRGYLMPWMELMFGQDQARLSKRADQLRYNLNYHYNAQDAVRSLGTDLGNARKPDSGPDREHAVKIIDLMRRNGLKTLSDLVNWIRDRWQPKPAGVDENFADGKNPGRKGLSRRVGIPRKASLALLAKIARSSTGERRRMAQWQLNMRRGRARKNK